MDLSELVQCVVCAFEYDEGGGQEHAPISVPCGHTLCKTCVDTLIRRTAVGRYEMLCPVCRVPHSVSDAGSFGAINYSVRALVQTMRQGRSAASPAPRSAAGNPTANSDDFTPPVSSAASAAAAPSPRTPTSHSTGSRIGRAPPSIARVDAPYWSTSSSISRGYRTHRPVGARPCAVGIDLGGVSIHPGVWYTGRATLCESLSMDGIFPAFFAYDAPSAAILHSGASARHAFRRQEAPTLSLVSMKQVISGMPQQRVTMLPGEQVAVLPHGGLRLAPHDAVDADAVAGGGGGCAAVDERALLRRVMADVMARIAAWAASLGQAFTSIACVLAVPLYFDTDACTKLMVAAEEADFIVLDILCDTDAALVHHHALWSDAAVAASTKRTIMLVDVGVSVVQVTLVRCARGAMDVSKIRARRCCSGVGTAAMTARLFAAHRDRIEEWMGALQPGSRTWNAVALAVDHTRTLFSVPGSSEVSIDAPDGSWSVRVTAAAANEAWGPCLAALRDTMLAALHDADGMDRADVHDVFLMGGGARMPAVQAAVRTLFSSTPAAVSCVDSEDWVMKGATSWAAFRTDALPAALALQVNALMPKP